MPRPKSRYVPALDGLRAFAVLAVIAYHMGMAWAPGGLLGVTMFFVLSGYLITCLLIAEFDYSGTIDLKDFWMRRIRRIIPAVLTCVIATAALCTLFNHALLTKMRPDMIPTLLFFNNWWQIFHNVSYFENLGAPSPLTHCWSLSIEEQFYLVWPVVLLACFKAGVKRKNIRRGLLVLICASALLMALLYNPSQDPSRVYYGTDTRVFSLGVGALLAFLWPYGGFTEKSGSHMDANVRTVFNAAGFAAVAGLVLMIVCINGFSPFVYRGGLLLCSLLTAVAIAVMVHPASIIGKAFAWRPLVWIGEISYGVYLWHYPLLLLTTPAGMDAADVPAWLRIVQLALIFGVSAASYYLVENPLRHGAIGKVVANVRNGKYTLREWLAAHAAGSIAAVSVLAIALGGCALVPATNTLEGGELLKNEEVQNNDFGGQDAAEVEHEPFDVLLIGDSVSVRAIPYFSYTFPFGRIDAQVNRQLSDAQQCYDPYVSQGEVGQVVVFSLGTNGVVTDEQIDDLMADVGSEKHVFFVNTRSDADWMETSNAALANAANRYDNATLIDWNALSADNESWFDGDGTHLSLEGCKAYVDAIYQAVSPYLPEHTVQELDAKRAENNAMADKDGDGYDDRNGQALMDVNADGVADDENGNGVPDSAETAPSEDSADGVE